MKHWWRVETQATVRRFYDVYAEDQKSAEAATIGAQPDHEEDIQEESMSIVPDPGREKVQTR